MGRRAGMLVVAAALLLTACGSASSSGSGSGSGPRERRPAGDPRVRRAERLFATVGPRDHFCTAAVQLGTRLVFAEAYGRLPGGRPATTRSQVDLASVSKQFTGVAVKLLEDEGELAGDDVVGDLVPASLPATKDLTVDELLTHTSGLADYGDLLEEEYDERTTQAEAVAAIAESEPTGTRGRFDYSNSNYVLLAEVVRAVSGERLPAFLRHEVFGPLGLDMAVDPRTAWKQVGDGSVWTTPTELVTWSRQYWNQTLDGPDLATVMFQPTSDAREGDPDVDDAYGAGVVRSTLDDGTLEFSHDGSWDHYETDWAVLPDERLTAAVTCDDRQRLDVEADDLLDIWRDA